MNNSNSNNTNKRPKPLIPKSGITKTGRKSY